MTTPQRFERNLPVLLEETYLTGIPDYRDDLVRRIATTRQRPAWMFPKRWLPMDLTTERVLVPRTPWRALALIGLIALVLAASAAIFIGAQSRRPDPFGLAATGKVAYEAGGDIYAADPTTGSATAVVTGAATESRPRFSRDGTRIAFARDAGGGRSDIIVVRADGSDEVRLTTEPVTLTPSILGEPWDQFQFSPDGRAVVIASQEDGLAGIMIAQADGSGVRTFDLGMAAYEPSFRPPDGSEILFVGRSGMGVFGLFALDVASASVRTIVEGVPGYDLAGANWSPTGDRIAYWRWGGPNPLDGLTARTHIVAADGTADTLLPQPDDAIWDAGSEWSNDGTRLILVRGYSPLYEDVRLAVVPADGSSTGIELRDPEKLNRECCIALEWAPDDSWILATPSGVDGAPLQQRVIDPRTGASTPAAWRTTSDPTVQRTAP